MDRTYIGGIERGERNVALRNVEKIAKALGISLFLPKPFDAQTLSDAVRRHLRSP